MPPSGGFTAATALLLVPAGGTTTVALDTIAFQLGHLGESGSATLMAQLTLTTPSPFTMRLWLTGGEVSRTFLPEPSRATQLAAGLAGLAGLATLRPWG